jgi:hypothetical protein
MERSGDEVVIAWTDVDSSTVKTAVLRVAGQ